MPELAIGVGAGLLVLLALAPATGNVLGTLAKVRAARAAVAQAGAGPAATGAIVAPGFALRARDPAAARALIVARIERLARAGGVLVEEKSAVGSAEGLVALRLRVSGAEKAVLAFADAFERERPLVRLRNWRLEPVAGGVRLTGDALAARQ
ncbi:hypothetical protein [Sphingomonas sp. M1-B02]|uniref:hypothetical protein n=1 Tax=Sphingomonas sp. M1-B02 TaxID=3114300 RepID=UPI00224013CD|nr:hypothetical protein [Sphingomonas sp. S6-11]UZK67475.1 hypothetical protein OKW87_06485 [Sphingomonas sp. S6-11]